MPKKGKGDETMGKKEGLPLSPEVLVIYEAWREKQAEKNRRWREKQKIADLPMAANQ
jgi:hypothetical protein